MPKRLCLVVSFTSVRRQPEKLGRRWWKVWKVLPGDRCWQSKVLVDQVCQRHEWVVPGIAAWYREELCSSVLQSYTVCAPGPAASEGWRVRLWCGRSVSDWRSAVPLHSEPTGVDALGGQEYPPTRSCRSPAGNAPGQLYQLLECGGRYISADLTQLTKSGKATRHRF